VDLPASFNGLLSEVDILAGQSSIKCIYLRLERDSQTGVEPNRLVSDHHLWVSERNYQTACRVDSLTCEIGVKY
jgi:hypothetical protein